MDNAVLDLILLIGSNPLPNYVAARAINPEGCIHLFYTKETECVASRLVDQLEQEGIGSRHNCCFIEDSANPSVIREAYETAGIPDGAHLHYTGGTKAMAVNIYTAWMAQQRSGNNASYLDDTTLTIFYNDGCERPVPPSVELNLELLAKLHGIDVDSYGLNCSNPPTKEDAALIADRTALEPSLPGCLYETVPNVKKLGKPISFSELGLSELSRKKLTPENSSEEVKTWTKFLRGEWLDLWVASLVEKAGDISDIRFNVNAYKNGRQIQLDVIAIKGYRLYLISCTTDRSLGICKQKAFEAAVRAQQLGGGLARSAVVTLLGQDNKGSDQTDELQNDMKLHWQGPAEPRIFGLRHIKEWVSGNCRSLHDWLDS